MFYIKLCDLIRGEFLHRCLLKAQNCVAFMEIKASVIAFGSTQNIILMVEEDA